MPRTARNRKCWPKSPKKTKAGNRSLGKDPGVRVDQGSHVSLGSAMADTQAEEHGCKNHPLVRIKPSHDAGDLRKHVLSEPMNWTL